jgi:hypothetical protein
MNGKKVKRIKQLLKHLQEKGLLPDQGWESATLSGQRKLNPECGKALYKEMKKRASI